jgi:twinkle protein
MFCGQVALDLCVQGQRTMIASFEMLPARTISRMVRQAFALPQPARTSIDAFHRWTDGRLWIFDHFGNIAGNECTAVCRYFAEALDGAHVFIDSMMMVCASEEHQDEQKQFMTGLVRLAQETGLHVHLVAHARKPAGGTEDRPPSKYDVRGSASVTDQAANVVTVWANKAKQASLQKDPNDADALAKPDALVTIEKQRNGEFEGRFQLWFDEGSLRFMNDRTSAVEPYVLHQESLV